VIEDPTQKAGDEFTTLRDAIQRVSSAVALLEWARANSERMNSLPLSQLNELRGLYMARRVQLRATEGEAVEDPARDAQAEADNEAREAFISSTRDHIRKATSATELGTWWNSPAQKQARRDFDLTKQEVADLVTFVKARLALLQPRMEAAE
jgi:hypothetical protein